MQRGFSLVELSIVLVILGLLTGGILAGQSLIRASELRSVTTEADRYVTAMQTFRDKYFALPGDMTNAEKFWGQDPGGCPAPINTVGKTQTCNGDGNGLIQEGLREPFRFWQQLAAAGLIEGSYTGVGGAANVLYDAIAGQNAPPSKLGNGLWTIRYINLPSSTPGPNRYAGNYGNTFQIGAKTTNGWNDTDLLKPEEAWNIDTKMDDGKPGRGKVVAAAFSSCSATTDPNNHNADYTLTTTAPACVLHILSENGLQF